METDTSIWLLLTLIPVLILGIVLSFFPGKVVQFRAKMQENVFKPFGLNLEDIDRSPFLSTLWGKEYSKRLRSEQEHPEDHRFLMMWTRIMGFVILFFLCIFTWLFGMAYKTGSFIK